MSTTASKCGTCRRDPRTVNNDISECSHVDCPHRGRQWSDGTPVRWRPPKKRQEPMEALFDEVEV